MGVRLVNDIPLATTGKVATKAVRAALVPEGDKLPGLR